MQNRPAVIFLVLAILFAVAAVLGAQRWLESQQPAVEETGDLRNVVVAKADVQVGTKLSAAQVDVAQWPSDHVPTGHLRETQQATGRVVRRPIGAGEPVLEGALLPEGAAGGLQSVIRGNRRAFSVKVDPVVGVAGFITPGTRVDVLATLRRIDQPEALPYSKVILQDVPVLAIDQKLEDVGGADPELVNVVTLELDPDQAQKLAYASHEGSIQLALRNPGDREIVSTHSVTVADVLTGTSRPMPVAQDAPQEAPSGISVEVIRGSNISVQSF